MKYRLRNLQCEFQHLNIVTAVNGYEMMLLLALKGCPGLQILACHQSIVEMLDILVSNAAYTGRENQRKGSAVSNSLQHSSAPFQVHTRKLHRTESHKKAYKTCTGGSFLQFLLKGFTSHNSQSFTSLLHMLIHPQYNGFLAWLEGVCPAGKAAPSPTRGLYFKFSQPGTICYYHQHTQNLTISQVFSFSSTSEEPWKRFCDWIC